MNSSTQLKVLELELQKQKKIYENCERKLKKYKQANKRVYNAISKEEINDLELELETILLEIQILKSKINDLQSN